MGSGGDADPCRRHRSNAPREASRSEALVRRAMTPQSLRRALLEGRRGFALAAASLAVLVLYVLRDALAAGNDRLPGIDAGNLYSWELYTRSVLATGQLPHWNPYQFAGSPHLADP